MKTLFIGSKLWATKLFVGGSVLLLATAGAIALPHNTYALVDTTCAGSCSSNPDTEVTTPETVITDPNSEPSTSQAGGSTAVQAYVGIVKVTSTGDSNLPSGSSGQNSQDPTPNPTSSNSTGTNTASVTNHDDMAATTGAASVSDSTGGGDATTGSATGSLLLTNQINSATGSAPSTFTINVNGDVNEPINLNSSDLTTPTSSPPASAGSTASSTNASINNYANISATSGDATVSNNALGGNAATGSANVNASVINIINSLIADKQSFVGTINIYGNLNGDIIIPADLVNALLSYDQAAGSAAPPNAPGAEVSQSTNQAIINTVNLTAISGDAIVAGNGSGGKAQSGSATTNLTVYNLVNNQVTSTNALLVIVNVVGHWVGFLLSAPAGTTSAMFGSGSGAQVLAAPAAPTGGIASAATQTITNTLNLRAQTGNALVTNNAIGGNATSGNASASANLVNFVGDQISLSGWFGILFINVFGNWNGSLALSTPAVSNGQTPPNTPDNPVHVVVIAAASHQTGGENYAYAYQPLNTFFTAASHNSTPSDPAGSTSAVPHVLAATSSAKTPIDTHNDQARPSWWLWVILGLIALALLAIAKRKFTNNEA